MKTALRKLQLTLAGMIVMIIIPAMFLLVRVDEFGFVGLLDLSTYNLRTNDKFWHKLDSLRGKGAFAILGDTLIPSEPYISQQHDEEFYSVEMLKEENVQFPYIHGVLMLFKETSFCRDNTERGVPTHCSDNWDHIFPPQSNVSGWNPYNYSGMKYPRNRKTTAIGSIGNVLQHMESRYGFKVKAQYRAFLINDPHAVYMSPRDHAKDLALWQQSRLKRFKKATTAAEYIEQLRAAGYNPYDSYYDDPKRGLYALLRMYESGEFARAYGNLYYERMGIALPKYEP